MSEEETRKTATVIFSVIMIGIGFYWFAIRPANIKTECSKDMKPIAIELKDEYTDYETGKMQEQLANGINSWVNYGICLTQHGL